MPVKIVVIGPESTGKSSLCRLLADHFKTAWVEEYARAYLLNNGKDYTFDDLFVIAEGQLQNEDSASSFNSPLFIDTDLYVIKIWSEFVFNKCDNRILNHIVKRNYDLYLLCNTDLPWEKDALREYPDLKIRQELYHYYKDAMINQRVPWVEISGGHTERLKIAINAVNELLKKITNPKPF